jgi:HrpA-like RNA helicase
MTEQVVLVTRHEFFHRNRRLREEAAGLGDKARRRGLVADDAALFDFYDQRIPKDVTSARHFDTWWKKARGQSPDLLTLSPADLVGPAADDIRPADYPDTWEGGLPLSYEFAPDEPDDGVTVVSLFAQVLGTSGPVSEKRILAALDETTTRVALERSGARSLRSPRARPRWAPVSGGPG